MNLLLDTHAFLWFCQDPSALSATAKALIEDPNNRKLLSVASCWEIAIKADLKKLTLGEPSSIYIATALVRTGFEILPIAVEHAAQVEVLAQHHRDPFDRMLIAQTMLENYPIVSIDTQFDAYPVVRLW